LSVFLLISLFICGLAHSQTETTTETVPLDSALQPAVAPPTSVIAEDHDYDMGSRIDLSWVPSIDDVPQVGRVAGYVIYRSVNGAEPVVIGEVLAGQNSFSDENTELDYVYSYSVASVSDGDTVVSVATAPVQSDWEVINLDRGFLFLFALLLTIAVVFFIGRAKRGQELFIRKIAGLEAVDEAIGRATEMGRPILFIPGIHDMDDVQTLAALTILGLVAEQVANYDTKISMPVARSLVMTAGRETIKAAYQTAGRPDAYNDDMVQYVTDEQFGYVAAVDGVMVREKPATIFLLGAFFAESLILAETGNSVGAIQIAGTARPAQLPFFIAACDFTLIGEELFAASAYLSEEPKQLGSLKGQDVGKGLAMVAILIGVLFATLHGFFPDVDFFGSTLETLRFVFTPR
jgi:hypothetical protein